MDWFSTRSFGDAIVARLLRVVPMQDYEKLVVRQHAHRLAVDVQQVTTKIARRRGIIVDGDHARAENAGCPSPPR